MGLNHKEEFERDGTIGAWTEKEINKLKGEDYWGIKLRLKDVKGRASLKEQIAIEIDAFLGYNNIDYISEKEIMEVVKDIMDLVNNKDDKK